MDSYKEPVCCNKLVFRRIHFLIRSTTITLVCGVLVVMGAIVAWELSRSEAETANTAKTLLVHVPRKAEKTVGEEDDEIAEQVVDLASTVFTQVVFQAYSDGLFDKERYDYMIQKSALCSEVHEMANLQQAEKYHEEG